MKTPIKQLVLITALLSLGACGSAMDQEPESLNPADGQQLDATLNEVVDEIPSDLCDDFDLSTRQGARFCLEAMVAEDVFEIPGVTFEEAVVALMGIGVTETTAQSVVENNIETLGIDSLNRTGDQFIAGCNAVNGEVTVWPGVGDAGTTIECNFTAGGTECYMRWNGPDDEYFNCG